MMPMPAELACNLNCQHIFTHDVKGRLTASTVLQHWIAPVEQVAAVAVAAGAVAVTVTVTGGGLFGKGVATARRASAKVA